uniref:Uncharacterized protein n=1 Tax=Megaselia scalaris TaxID=36166 RepID=T1H424_MEGSC
MLDKTNEVRAGATRVPMQSASLYCRSLFLIALDKAEHQVCRARSLVCRASAFHTKFQRPKLIYIKLIFRTMG